MRKLTFLAASSLLVASCLFSKLINCEDYSFQFPCYVDVCMFPRQFCDSAKSEKKCNDCVLKFCGTPDMPLACKFFCDKAARSSEKAVEGSDSTGGSETGFVGPGPKIIIALLSVLCIGLIIYILVTPTTVRQMIADCRRYPRNIPVHPASSETEMKVLVDSRNSEEPNSRTEVVTSATL